VLARRSVLIGFHGMDLDQLARSFAPMHEAMAKATAQRADASFCGSGGGGAVKVTLGGDLVVKRVEIAPAAAASVAGDAGMLEDLLAAAANDALRQYRNRFGATPDEQLQRVFASSGGAGGMQAMLGPLLASLGKR
jgi:nucleoid-associated protein EbfC